MKFPSLSVFFPHLRKISELEGKNKLAEILLTYRKILIYLFFFSGLLSFLSIVPALYMFQIYDSVLTTRNVTTLLMLTLIVVFMYAFFWFLDWTRSQILIKLSNELDLKLRDKVFLSVLRRIVMSGSTSASQAFNDLTNLRQFLTGAGLTAFLDLPWMPVYIVVIFLIHPVLGIYSIVVGIIQLFLAILNEYLTKKELFESNKHYHHATSFLQANLRNAEVIEAMGMHSAVRNYWLKKYLPTIELQHRASRKAGVLQSIIKTSRIAFQSGMLGLGAYFAINNVITAGEMIMASILMGRALSPIDTAVANWRNFVSARESYRKLSELLFFFEENKPSVKLPPPKGYVSFENVMVSPPQNPNFLILKNISFSAQPGELICIIGPTAAGKSTLAKTITGVWKAVAGRVRIDGADINHYDKEHLGQYIGYLPQDIELFDGTIAENIARFGEIDSEKVIRAAQIAGVHEIILNLPQGYDTPIGEAGAYLSGGQRQRIALARALYGDPSIIVLDEPNSNLDEQGEIALMKALKIMKRLNKTIFVISHKPNILNLADKVMVIVNGSIFAFGPKEEVLKLLREKSPAKTLPETKREGMN